MLESATANHDGPGDNEGSFFGQPEHSIKFDAFLSYRRLRAAGLARWLRNKLVRYKPPPELIDVLPDQTAALLNRPREIFLDTAFEKANEDFWSRQIVPSLTGSRSLIVISTPDAFESRPDGSPNWLAREVDTFYEICQDPKRIIVVLGPGAPEDRFPGRLSELSQSWDWVDLRSYTRWHWFHLGRIEKLDAAFAKLIASLYDIPTELLPILRREERRRRGRILLLSLSFAVALSLVMAGLTIYAFRNAQLASENEALAAQRRLEALRSESAALASQSSGELKQGDIESALQEASRGLPTTRTNQDRPIVSDSLQALFAAQDKNKEVRVLRTERQSIESAMFVGGGSYILGIGSGGGTIWSGHTGRVVLELSRNWSHF